MSALSCPVTGIVEPRFFEVRITPSAGRGVFALHNIPRNTTLLATSCTASVAIYSEYVKEVCAQCFGYNRGKTWPLPLRDNAKGVMFCSYYCKDAWQRGTPDDVGIAREEIQKLLRKPKRGGADREVEFLSQEQSPSPEEIDKRWEAVELVADQIRACRTSAAPTKTMRRALEMAKCPSYSDDGVVWYLLQGCICAAQDEDCWTNVEQLAKDDQPYSSLDLARHTQAYVLLLAILPTRLLPSIRQSVIRSLQSHSTHNVFGLRSLDEGGEDGDAGSECFGYGLWPDASYWNHSCTPNVQKRRSGRLWRFWTSRDVAEGEELCITYLGGEERDLSTSDRRQKLLHSWGFQCACTTCQCGGG